MKISRYTIILNELMPNFMNDVDSIQMGNDKSQLSLKDEKASLIAAAKQFQDTIKKRIATNE
jgi:hypothetical protein